MAFEILPALKVVVAALNADADLMARVPGGVHLVLAPEGAPFPYIVVQPVGQSDIYGADAARVLSMPLLMIKILAEGASPAPVEDALNRLDVVVSAMRGITDGFYLHGATREPASAILYLETRSDASQILHAGGTYRAHLSQIS